jgi:glycerophosphoryl diester phosphodiesterase
VRSKWISVSIFAGCAGVLAVFCAVALRRKSATPGRLGQSRSWPAGFAHRGASARVPENTLEAFREAVEVGARALELDVHMSLDREIIVLHDASVDRTTDGSGPVNAMPLAELKKLDAGYRFTPDGATHSYRGRGIRVPTLSEVFREFPEVVVNFEIKAQATGIEEAVLREIHKANAGDRTLVTAEKHGIIRRFRKVSDSEIPTAASRFELGVFYLLSQLRLEWMFRPAYAALQIPVRHGMLKLATKRFLEAAHSRNVRVDVWTVDDPAEMRRLLDLGADGIMSNRPDLLSRVLDERRNEAQAKLTSPAEITPNRV